MSPSADEERSDAPHARLAAAAGSAIAESRLTDEMTRRERSQSALQDVAVALLAGSATDDVFRLAATHAMKVHSAVLGVVALTTPCAGELRVIVAIGEGAEEMEGLVMTAPGSIPADVMRTGQPIQTGANRHEPGQFAPTPGILGDGPHIWVPMSWDGAVIGTLGLARVAGAPPFDSADLALLHAYGSKTGLILDGAQAQQDALAAVVLREQDRIVRELLDSVIRRLFAIGLSLASAAGLDEPATRQARVQRAIDETDHAIRQIRSTVFSWQSRPVPAQASGRRRRDLGCPVTNPEPGRKST